MLSACSWLPRRVETVTVNVPVEVARTPPPELLACGAQLRAPFFVSSTDPAVSSCLMPEGERALTRMVDEMLTCIAAWRAWAEESER